MKGLPDLLDDEENPRWVSFCTNVEKAVSSHALLPLHDASKCLPKIVGHGVTTVRSGTI